MVDRRPSVAYTFDQMSTSDERVVAPLYLPRVVDLELDELFSGLPAISIVGPRAVGKTVTASRRANTIYRLEDPRQHQILAATPSRLVSGDRPILIDEWERIPESWDFVRRAVDADGSGGQFLLTGSATPSERPVHSGAGRIVRLRMRPMSLAERGLHAQTVSLAQLLSGKREPVAGRSAISLEGYARELTRSGFPGFRSLTDRQVGARLDSYIDHVVEHDFADPGGYRVRNPGRLRDWLAAYAAATSTTAAFETIRDAATADRREKPARSTVEHYLEVLRRLWLIDPVPSWLPTRNRIRRLASPSKHQLADPALAARLLDIGPDGLLAGRGTNHAFSGDGPMFGALFESQVTLDVRTYAQAAGARVAHLRTKGGEREIDLIVVGQAGRVLAVEVKLGELVNDRDVRHLHWLEAEIGRDLLDKVIVTTGTEAYRRGDGVAVVPAVLLGP